MDFNHTNSSYLFLTLLVVTSLITRRWDVQKYNMTAVKLNFSYPEKNAYNEDVEVVSADCVCSFEEEAPPAPDKTDANVVPQGLSHKFSLYPFPLLPLENRTHCVYL